jgi:hypothetical protein
MSFRPFPFAGFVLAGLGVLVAACASTGSSHPQGTGSSGASSGGSGGSSGSSGGIIGGGDDLGDDSGVGSFGSGGPPEAGDAGHLSRCDDAGNCSCVAIASIGHEGVWGPCSMDTTSALQAWLNTQSNAKVDNYDTVKPTLTPDFLAKYDVLLLQWMVADGVQYTDGAPWVFSADEISALKDWVNNGGGLIALNGYQCNGQGCPIVDVTATNQLLSFTDIQFNSDDVLDPSPPVPPTPACQDCYCWGGAVPLGGPLAAGGASSVGTWDQTTPLGAHMSDTGAYVARSIHSTSATVDASDATHQYAVHEQIGKGHVFAYGDEWVSYTGEWLGTTVCLDYPYTNPSDPCYQKSAAQVFQIPQFWYNAIKYAASSVQCSFTLSNPGVIQ